MFPLHEKKKKKSTSTKPQQNQALQIIDIFGLNWLACIKKLDDSNHTQILDYISKYAKAVASYPYTWHCSSKYLLHFVFTHNI